MKCFDLSVFYFQVRRTVVTRVHEAVKALALCHNVTPVRKGEGNGESEEPVSLPKLDGIAEDNEGDVGAVSDDFTYQASSPDEVALVTWAETVGLSLINRDLTTMTLRSPHGQIMVYEILQIFPFTSESKRMGIIVKVRL